jgi:hypothetical protein
LTAEQTLIIACDRLRRSQPMAWNEFRAAMAEFAGASLMTLAASPDEVLRVNQGKTQCLLALNKMFEECAAKAENIIALEKTKHAPGVQQG